MKSDLRVSNTLTWNTFPLPAVTEAQRALMIAAGREVLSARNLHPLRSLADHYNPLSMVPELLRAHRKLDKAVDLAFGIRAEADDVVRLKALFTSYAALAR